MKRVVLFLLTNLAVMLVLGVVVNLLGLSTFISRSGLNLPVLFGFALVFGMGGSFIGYAVDRALAGDSEEEPQGPGMGYWITSLIAELFLGFLASMIVMWFSRRREFWADAGGVQLAGRQKMTAALQRLRQMSAPSHLPAEMAAFGIRGGGGLTKLFMTHPPLEERIAALQAQD